MQVPAAHHLGTQDVLEPPQRLLREHAVLQHARGVHDAPQRRHALGDLGHDASDVLLPRHIRADHVHFGA